MGPATLGRRPIFAQSFHPQVICIPPASDACRADTPALPAAVQALSPRESRDAAVVALVRVSRPASVAAHEAEAARALALASD